MQTEYKIVIVDTSCIILLDKIGELELLRKVFYQLTVTTVIADEFGKPLPLWLSVKSVNNTDFQKLLDIDAGEASAIALAIESELHCLLLMTIREEKLRGDWISRLRGH